MVPLNQLFLKDKELLHTADIANSSYRQWQAYGFPIPFIPNLNASEAESTVTTGAIDDMPCPSTPATCPSTPATQDKRKIPVDTLPREVIDLVEEDRGETGTPRPLIENQRGLCFSSPMAASAAIPSEQQASQVHEALPHETSSLQPIAAEEDEHGGNHGIDLNETPQHKPKRKKHRPKVIREGRQSTTPKPKTPKPVTPKPAGLNTDKPNGKRKYVRKKNLCDVNNPSSAVAEVVEPVGRGGTKSVRRSLNFDTEGGDTRDKSPGSTSMFKLNAESQAQGVCVMGTTISPSTKSNVRLTQGPEVVVGSQATISFDLNLSADPMLNEYITFSQKPAQNHQPSIRKTAGTNQVRNAYNGRPGLQAPHTQYNRRELIRENLNNLATQNDSMEVFRNVDGSVTDLLVIGSKRGRNLVDDARASTLLKIVNAYNDIRHVSHIGEICKKRRTKEQVEFASDSSSVTSSSLTCDPAKSWDTHQMQQNRFTFADAQSLMAQRNLQTTEAMMSFRQTDRMTTNRYPESFRAQDITSLNDAVNCNQISVPGNLPSRADDREENGAYGIPACMEPIISGSQEKKEPTVHRKKGQTQIVNSIPADANVISVQDNGALSGLRSPAVYKSFQATPAEAKRSNKKNSDLHIQDCQSISSFQESLNTGFSSQTIPPFEVLIEDIIQKLQYLEINKGYEDATGEAQNALVVYDGGVNKMVPHEGQLILVKKRRPRVKVDLDPETHRMWKLLMGKESTEGNDAMDKNKEKWWEEERRVFHGRAESFIARMHLVQGDRRFSQWKGSVVDSVVGVFLTQNVSDHLSSSAFMALAAKFPLRPRGNSKEVNTDKMNKSAFMQDESIVFSCDATEWNRKMPGQEFAGGGTDLVYESQDSIGKEIKDSRPIQCNSTGSRFDNFEGTDMKFGSGDLEISNGSLYSRNYVSLNSWTNILGTVTGGTGYVDTEDRRFLGDIISSQSSVVSSQNSSEYPLQTAYQVGLALEASTEAVLIMENMFNAMDNSTSFTKLLEMADGRILSSSSEIDQLTPERLTPHLGCLDYHERAFSSMFTSSSFHSVQQDFLGQPYVPSTSEHVHTSLKPTLVESQCAVAIQERSVSNLPPSVLSSTDNINTIVGTCGSSTENTNENTDQLKWSLCLNTNPVIDLHASMSRMETCKETHFLHNGSISWGERTGASLCKNISHLPLQSQDEHMKVQQNERKSYSERESAPDVVEIQAPMPSCKIYQMLPKPNENLTETPKVFEPITSQKDEVYNAVKVGDEKDGNAPKRKKVRVETEKKSGVEWDSLRRQACSNGTRKERSNDMMDSVDWEAVRQAEVKEISETIRERGMNNMLAERIKEFLNRLVTEHGSIDLEWLRDVPPDKVKDYLLSIRGLGLKSVECVRLLTLHHVAFPVDTNVGRICVRLGWVPLQPLPESLQLHLLELYPVLETIQKYLWPRLCTLDQRTLYELHYQMITFGKVFCTKSKPNCNACPMRGECKHFASAFASARLALPGPEEKSLVSSTISATSASSSNVNPHLVPLAQLEERSTSQEGEVRNICEPIIEEPTSPEPGCAETSESAIEDAFFEDPDEIPTIKLNLDMFTQNLQNYMQANNMEIQDSDMSRALVLLSSAAASIPMPKLKNVSRLRTEHLVYELPDSHPLLEGLDQRESDDPCPYLLAIWAPGETAQSTEPPNISCNLQETGRFCDQQTCFTCNSKREAETQIVRGTLLIPCRTAMRGSFPLNGTYFQVNEVFADHDSSHKPIDVPRDWIWNLPRRTVYFGTSIPTIFKGLSTEGIQHCFWRGFVCVRGFDRTTRAPKPLYARLHFPASKAIRNKHTATNHKE